MFAPAVL